MRLECAMVCDAVTVRDGLLHILGGGIGRVPRLGFPASLDNEVAVRLVLTPEEVKAQHKIEIRVLTSQGALASTVTGEFATAIPDGRPVGTDISLSIPVSLRQVVLPGPDRYEIEIVVDAESLTRIPLEVTLVSPPA
jgi:hypothetical protein